MGFFDFFMLNKWVILFYSIVVLLVYLNRKKFDMQGIIALYRTKIGLKQMDSLAKKHGGLISIIGLIGIGIAYIGLILISIYLCYNLYQLITVPKTTAGVSLIVPGVQIPGSPFNIPLVEGWLALFIIVAVHEFSHGVMARAHNLRVKSSGIVFFGPILGAFVEPDEKQVGKSHDATQYSIFAAGPVSNIALAIIVMLAASWMVFPAINALTTPSGFSIMEVQEGFPAQIAGLKPNEIIDSMNGIKINSSEQFYDLMKNVMPNQTITLIEAGKEINITATAHPDGLKSGYIGVKGFKNEFKLEKENAFTKTSYAILKWVLKLLELVYMLSLGIGLVNLLPVGPTDGGRMLLLSLKSTIKDQKKAMRIFTQVSMFFLAILALNIFYPWISKMFF